MDYREKVFEMVGVEPHEEFYLGDGMSLLKDDKDKPCRFFINVGLVVFRKGSCRAFSIDEILLGHYGIVKIPKEIKPTKEEQIAIDYARLCGYKWLAKDKDEDYVKAYTEKPIKSKKYWLWNGKGCWMIIRIPISFISWEDDEPYYIGGDEE